MQNEVPEGIRLGFACKVEQSRFGVSLEIAQKVGHAVMVTTAESQTAGLGSLCSDCHPNILSVQ